MTYRLHMQGKNDHVEKVLTEMNTARLKTLTTVSRALFLDVLHQIIKYNKKYKIMPQQMQKRQQKKSNIIVFTCYKQYVGIIQLLNVTIVYISG